MYADLTKVRCFKCQKFGHISAHCPDKSVKGKDDGKEVIKDKGKTKGKSKGKVKGKGFGKKGKMNELGYAEETDEFLGNFHRFCFARGNG